MSAFRDFWKNQSNPEARVKQIDLLMSELDAQMQSKVDPTRWRKLLDHKEALERERIMLTQ